MKSAIIGSIVTVALIATFMIIGTLQINTNITDELNDATSNAIYATQRQLIDVKDSIKSNDAYLAEFEKNLRKQLNNTDEVTYSIEAYGLDYKKGLIDVGVTAKYKNLYGKEKKEKTRRTMIINVLQD